MSDDVQRRARDRRDAAKRREQSARDRADRNRDRGEDYMAEQHALIARYQASVAYGAEQARRADAAIEGDRLDKDAP